jgi:hypothetical protein
MPESEADRPVPAPRTSTDDAKGAGLYDHFGAYRTPTDADYHELFTNGLIIPDTNVLLSLYRYNAQTRNDLLAVLGRLGDNLWVPHQVIEEFFRNREAVLKDPQGRTSCTRQLSAHRDQATGVFSTWANRVRLPQERSANLLQVITKAFSEVIQEVEKLPDKHSSESARDTNKDPVLIALEPLLDGRVGRPLAKDEYEQALQEARTRAELKQPPGYKDLSKTDGGAAGDYLIWVQVLREAKARKRDVLLVTGDVKEDWWRREYGETRGPRPELVREIKEYADVKLYMLRPERLLSQAGQVLKIEIRDDSLQDAERVSEIPMVGAELVRQSWDRILESVEKRSRVATRYLRSATADSLDEDSLTVMFRSPADAQSFIASGSAAALSQALDEVLGIERGIIVFASEDHHLATFAPRSWARSVPETPASTDPPEDDPDLAE